MRRHPDAPVVVAELLFGQRLRAGETWVFERRIVNPGKGPPSTVHAHAVRHRVEHYLLQIRFDPSALPVDCHAFTQTDLYEPWRRVADLPLSVHHDVHQVGAPLITGIHGIQWSWSPPGRRSARRPT